MNIDSGSQSLAREGLRHIETAILRLLDANPQGLRNADIARNLGLSFDFGGNYKNQLTYGVLGNLMAQGKVSRHEETKLFTSMGRDTSAFDTATSGLRRIEEAILQLLEANPEGLRNVDVADLLHLRSDFQGGQKNYLTYTVLMSLLEQGKVSWDRASKMYSKT